MSFIVDVSSPMVLAIFCILALIRRLLLTSISSGLMDSMQCVIVFFLFIYSMKINRKQHASSIDNSVCTHSSKETTIHGKLRFDLLMNNFLKVLI